MKTVPVAPPKTLQHFIDKKRTQPSATPRSEPVIKTYRSQHPTINPDLERWSNAHRILSKSTNPSSGQGFDFLQEQDLKGVLKYIPKGTMFDINSFARAVRTKQHYEDNFEAEKTSNRRTHDKFTIESQIVGVVHIKNGFTSTAGSTSNPFSEDLFQVNSIYESNLELFFTKRIDGCETSGIKIRKFFFTTEEFEESLSLENKTKDEIIKCITDDAENSSLEPGLVNSIKHRLKPGLSKPALIEIYHNVHDAIIEAEQNFDIDEDPE